MEYNLFNGVLPINKEPGMTSHDVIDQLRKMFNTKKIGHTGTLDPAVSGVLPICVGTATRISEFIMEMPKTYIGQMTLGKLTDTQDFTGTIIKEAVVQNLRPEEIYEVFNSFLGEIEQVPPMYSSVKVDGKKLYQLAREGKEIERKPRKVTIYSIKVLSMDLKKDFPTVDFQVTCSKGTYIRTLCVDIGEKLGYPALMSDLVRTSSGSFNIESAYTLDEVQTYLQQNRANELFTSMNDALPLYQELILSDEEINNRILNGQRIQVEALASYSGIIKMLDNKKGLHALYSTGRNEYTAKPLKVFK